MKKLKKVIKAISILINNPWKINLIIDSNYEWNSYVEKKFPAINKLPVTELEQLGLNENEKIITYSFLDGGSLVTDIALLQILCRKFEHCSYFEIGTWRGESVTNVAEYAKTCYTLNLPEEEIIKRGLGEPYAKLHGFFSIKNPKITHLKGNTLTFNFKALNTKFDVVFIDGDHSYEMVLNDTRKIFDSLIHPKTIIVWHDYAYNPEKIRYEVLAAILDGIPKELHKNIYHVSNTLCAIYSTTPYPTRELVTPVVPVKKYTVNIQSNPIT